MSITPLLVTLRGTATGQIIELADETTVGDPCGEHDVVIVRHGGRYVIRDLGSTHRVWIGDRCVTECVLQDDDVIRIGSALFKFIDHEIELHSTRFTQGTRDGLTGLANGPTYRAAIAQHLGANAELSIAMFDIDRLRDINDRAGSIVGDDAIAHVARVLGATAAPHLVARIGGDEFVVVLAGFGRQFAIAIAETARGEIAKSALVVDAEPIVVTVSGGTASAEQHATISDLEMVAHARMRAAKSSGRNRIL